MSQMDGFEFVVETVTECDPTLAIHDANGQWHFNDDGPTDLQPQLVVNGASLNGNVDIWVGSFGGGTCQGTIVFQTRPASASSSGGFTPPGGGGATPVAGCPAPGTQGTLVQTTGTALYSPTDYSLTAGGPTEVSTCGLPVDAWGFFGANPNFSFMLSGMEEYGRLEIEAFAECDTVMLVRTPDGQWHFNDDTNGLDPAINITPAANTNGQVDVWLGTYGGGTCTGAVEMETWHN